MARFKEKPLPDDKVLVPGVIDTCTISIEHPEVVAQHIGHYADAVGRERVIAGTDCGFASLAKLHTVDPDIAWRKLEALVQGRDRVPASVAALKHGPSRKATGSMSKFLENRAGR